MQAKATIWQKRYKKRNTHPLLDAFNSSSAQDRFLYQAEIAATRAYIHALQRAAVLSTDELRALGKGLNRVAKRIAGGEATDCFEDIHTAVELMLTEECGAVGQKVHTGRSRNEQVATDERLYLKQQLQLALQAVAAIQTETIRLARAYPALVMPAYTHLQQGQVVLFSHYILALFWAMQRGKERLAECMLRVDSLPLGSGALAGCTIPLDRERMRRDLHFSSISANSLDAVSDRSFIVESLFALALILLDLSRYAEDFIIFSSREFSFFSLADAITTSSSLMPQKKNPDIFELVRAKAGVVFGYASQLFITLKGLPNTYNKDLQCDKLPLFHGTEEALQTLRVFALALPCLTPNAQAMAQRISADTYATDLVDYLVRQNIPFREAHGIIGALMHSVQEQQLELSTLTLAELRHYSHAFNPDVFAIFDSRRSVEQKRTLGSTNPDMVRLQIKAAEKALAADRPKQKRQNKQKTHEANRDEKA